MRASRRFVPSPMPTLEDRVVPSQLAPHTGAVAAEFRPAHLTSSKVGTLVHVLHTVGAKPTRLTSAQIAQSNASDASFGMSVSDTIHSGQPVAEVSRPSTSTARCRSSRS